MMDNKVILGNISFRKLSIVTIVLFFAISTFSKIWSQDTSGEEVRRLQHAIFVFNFGQQIGWKNFDKLDTFKIGVLGPDRTIIDLKSMAQKRKISGKPVEVIRFQFVKNVKDIQLLYVNNKYNYSVEYILSKIEGKQILLVTEDYNFNTSMINMINVGDSFRYEINEQRIKDEGFTISSSLKKHAITSSEKWRGLYAHTEESLEKVLEENKEHKEAIKNKEKQIKQQEKKIISQEKVIDTIANKVSEKNKWIEELSVESRLRKKKYEEKLQIERELEKNIQEQLEFIKSQEDKIKISTQEIENQRTYLEAQNKQIKLQEEILERQTSEISDQKKTNLLLTILAAFILLGSILLYWGYSLKKKLSKELQEKNKEIQRQSSDLESKNKELEQFAYIASHDLQEPLNTISSFIGLLSEDYSDKFDEVGKESLTFIQNASERMKRLIDGLLEYSRLGRTKDFTVVNLNTIIEEIEADFGVILEKTNAVINVGNIPQVYGSELELRLLLQNLISNAIKFTEESIAPIVTISANQILDAPDKPSGVWEFSVKDNGIGIPIKHKDRIFAIFQRLHSRDKYQGTGIGLAHCKKIVASHGGTIWFDSIVGEGSTFYFTIPI